MIDLSATLRPVLVSGVLFLETSSHPESLSKLSNLMITELFHSYILNMKRGSVFSSNF